MRYYLFQLPIIFLSEFLPSPSSARLALPAEACAPAGAAAAPPRSPRSGGTSHAPNSRINCNYKQTGDKCGIISFNYLFISIGIFVFPKLRAARASCGSSRPCGRGGCAAPLAALEVVKKFLLLPIAGALPLQPRRGTRHPPRTPV